MEYVDQCWGKGTWMSWGHSGFIHWHGVKLATFWISIYINRYKLNRHIVANTIWINKNMDIHLSNRHMLAVYKTQITTEKNVSELRQSNHYVCKTRTKSVTRWLYPIEQKYNEYNKQIKLLHTWNRYFLYYYVTSLCAFRVYSN